MRLLPFILVLALFLAACSGVAPSVASQPSPAATSVSEEPAPEATRCPTGSLEGCFTYAEMQEYLDAVTPMVASYFQTTFPRLAAPHDIVFVPRGRLARSACGGAPDSFAYEYCAADRRIFIGQDLLWSFYSRQGDAAPVVGLAHEWAHHVQYMLGMPFPRTADESVVFENQADCLSGAYIRYADEQGWLESDDMDDIDGLLRVIGSRERAGRDHGTSVERRRSFELGLTSGAVACNVFFPDDPLI